MKKAILFIFCFISLITNAQNPDKAYSVKGKIGSYNPPAKIHLQYLANNQLITQTSELHNGEFSFSGKVNVPANARIILIPDGEEIDDYYEYEDALAIVLVNEKIVINSPSSLSEAIISESLTNDDVNKLSLATMPTINKIIALSSEFRDSSNEKKQDEDYLKQFQTRYNLLQKELDNAYISFIKENPTSIVSLLGIVELFQHLDNANTIDSLIKGLSPELQQNPLAQKLIPQVEEKKLTSIGSLAPEFNQKNPEGILIHLSDFRGKYLLIDFWASWCKPCRIENPFLVKAYEQFKNKNFEILGVSLDNRGGKSTWENAIERDQLTWPQVSDLNGWQNAVALQYKVLTIPQNFLLDPEGRIIAKNLKGEVLIKKLEEIFSVNNKQ